MKNKKHPGAVTREDLVRILNDEEAARVTTPETAASLEDGDEFIDLMDLGRGVQRVEAANPAPAADVLAKKAVHENTWLKIVANLNARKLLSHVPPPPPPREPR